MEVSITIQTYNRADELRKTLLSLAKVKTAGLPKHEIVVVDNNSSDQTRNVVEELKSAFPGTLRYVHELRQGLSHARNRAINEARFEIVAFLDDDVDVNVNWLRNLAAAFDAGNYAAIGGRAYLVFPSARPTWLAERSDGALTRMDYGPKSRAAAPDELYGVNLSIRKEWLQQVGGFRTDLGRIGTCLLGSEETDVLERIAAAGGKLLYEPGAEVGHRVPVSRLRRRWFWSRSYWGSRGEARMIPSSSVTLYGFLRASWRLGRAGGKVIWALISNGPRSEECFYQSRLLLSRLGSWVGLVGRLGARCRRVFVSAPAQGVSEAN